MDRSKPDPGTFYDDVMKRGGKKAKKTKKKAKKTKKQYHDMTMSNQPNTGVYSFQAIPRPNSYEALNSVYRMMAPSRPMANAPGIFNPSHYGIAPTQISDFRRPPEHQGGMAPTAPIARDWGRTVHTTATPTPHTTLDRPALSVPIYAAHENPRDVAPLNTNASRAIPTELRPRGGVLYEQAGNSMSVAFGYPENKEERDSVNYFRPTGRDNIAPPVPSKVTGAPPVDFFPLRAQSAVSREDEQARSAWQTPPPIRVGPPAPSGYASSASTPRSASPAPSSLSDAPGMERAVPGMERAVPGGLKPLLPKHLWPEGVMDIRYDEKGKKISAFSAPAGMQYKSHQKKYMEDARKRLKEVEAEHGYKRGGKVHSVFC